MCAEAHAGRRLDVVICVDAKGNVYAESCSLDVCRRLLPPSQKPCEEIVGLCYSRKICAACEKNGFSSTTELKMVSCKQSGFERSAFSS